MSEVQEVEQSQDVAPSENMDATVLKNRVVAYTKQCDEFVGKAQQLHAEIDFCHRMLELMGETITPEEE